VRVRRIAEARAQNERERVDLLLHLHARIQGQLLGRFPPGHLEQILVLIEAPSDQDWLSASELVVVDDLFAYLSPRERHQVVRHAWRWAWAQATHDTPRGELAHEREAAVMLVSADANRGLRLTRGLTFREAWSDQIAPLPDVERFRTRDWSPAGSGERP